ncbi:hypothetical protein [Tsukamurella sp. PLM1]|uniref:hypothetical protein n=1 Tax=Tsukamurella sp. PLM1 TaxID=2929795 RepID=UPI0020694560|nr:hypothetical protein [Tsukamurella sp. PLM1]BDH58149.1 hypothetical protein MTP03_30880 [Tsukamurella sp. PLM1]
MTSAQRLRGRIGRIVEDDEEATMFETKLKGFSAPVKLSAEYNFDGLAEPNSGISGPKEGHQSLS